jgi:hypothetical protein
MGNSLGNGTLPQIALQMLPYCGPTRLDTFFNLSESKFLMCSTDDPHHHGINTDKSFSGYWQVISIVTYYLDQ